MRKLASIRKISDIRSIPDADKICAYVIDGWTIVDSIGKHNINDLVVMCEIDSWIPHKLAPFLSKDKEPRIYEGIAGERLKTVKLRGQISQGLILPLVGTFTEREISMLYEEMDVTDILNIKKYEKPVSAKLGGVARGNFPGFIRKTDQERIQNLKRDMADWANLGYEFEVTEKLDGTSCTIYKNSDLMNYDKEPLGVCSRNLDLKETEGNTYWSIARTNDVHAALLRDGRNLAVQGEIIGEGIQGNKYKFSGHHFYVFDIYDIDNRCYLSAGERVKFCITNNLKMAPTIHERFSIGDNSIADLLLMAEGDSILHKTQREGLVFKCLQDPSVSFKAISNKFLLKHGDD